MTGGYGGAKFIVELAKFLKEKLVVVCNVGDDIEMFGLKISPDIDTVIYALSGLLDEDRTWGVKDDTFNFLNQFKNFSEIWFSLGDKDLAVHIYRTWRMKNFAKLSQVTSEIASALKIKQTILPCTDETLQTFIEIRNGIIHYQEFYVKHQAKPEVKRVYYRTNDRMYFAEDILINNKSIVPPSDRLLDLFEKAEKVIIAPSNPVASIGPILAVNHVRKMLEEKEVIAISPMVKNLPTDDESILRRITSQKKLMEAIGLEHNPFNVAWLYRKFLDVFFLDVSDVNYLQEIKDLGISVMLSKIVPRTEQDKKIFIKDILKILK